MAVPKHRKTSTKKKIKYNISKGFRNRSILYNEFDIYFKFAVSESIYSFINYAFSKKYKC